MVEDVMNVAVIYTSHFSYEILCSSFGSKNIMSGPFLRLSEHWPYPYGSDSELR